EEFETLKNFLLEQRFDHVGIFTYSREEDTPAYDLPDQVSEEVMQERYHELMSINSMISQQKNEELRGRELEALVVARDEDVPNIVAGRSYREAPEVDGLVYIEGDDGSEIGDMMRVRVVDGFVDDVAAERIDEGEA
ncbi:MAG: 30S ribosomal protein S12 methylthiotransferase RimO, partial [Selenomonadaceae bacterium]|nr:30S ribosomal protein S12 methylthiotransferase RimO [Selenomonadaceae bacterium]